MKIRLLTLTALLLAVWMSPPGLAAESIPFDLNDPAMLIKLSEAGGPTLAILLSMHWLRENYQRRLEENQLRLQESQRYSENLLSKKSIARNYGEFDPEKSCEVQERR